MADNEENTDKNNEPVGQTAESIIKQIDNEGRKKRAQFFKNELQKIRDKVFEHEKALRLLRAEENELVDKFNKGLI